MSSLILCLLIVTQFLFVSSVENKGCPFHSKEQTSKSKIRGHQEPFGYHAKQWKRIETLYEHPHPEVFYEKYMRASKPVIIRGGAKDWPAIHKWTNLTYLNHQSRFGRPDINWKKMYSYDPYHPVRVRMTMKEFTRDFNQHSLYMDATLPEEIAEDVHWPKSLACKFYQKRTKQLAIMFNNGKSSSDVHMDSTCTYFVQVTGSRRWLLTPPTEVENIYSGDPSLVDHLGISIINQNLVDLEKHDKVKHLTIYGAIMDPGDIIYVPEGWHHQVKTYNSPNIGVVVFMNYLLCEFHSNTDDADVVHVKKCVYKIREQRPKTLKCDPFPEDNIPIPKLLKDHPPPVPSVFMQHFERGNLDFGVSNRIMNNGEEILPVGISLVGYDGKSKDKKSVLKLALIEGFRMFCISTADRSPLLIGNFFKKHKKLMKKIKLIAYLSRSDYGRNKVPKAIDRLLKNINSTFVDTMLLQADYCSPVNGTEPCQRDMLTQEMIETWKAMEKAHRDGKIDTLGVSDFSLQELKELKKISTVPISIARARFDPFFRNKEYRAYCRSNKIIFMGRSVLGNRWRSEKPELAEKHNIVTHYHILRAAFQYKTSVHGVVYDWAVRKGVIICPPMDNDLHVRVTAQAFRTESKSNPDNLNNIDEYIDPSDGKLFSPGAKNYLQKQRNEEEEEEGDDEGVPTHVQAGEEQLIDKDDLDNNLQAQYEAMTKSEIDFSNEVYTDNKDFERFPDFMNVKDPFQ